MGWLRDNAPEWLKKVEHYVEDIGYGIANLFGLGETANNLVNELKKFIDPETQTFNSTQLIAFLKEKFGTSVQKLNQIIGLIDSKLSQLPPTLSGNMKKIINNEKTKLLNSRRKATTELSKVEQSMNIASGIASGQDYLSPSRKEENQELVQQLADNNSSDIIKDIERTL